jgi:hypothetical protein
VEILSKTYRDEKTLFDYYKLDEGSANAVADSLYLQTTGHPRSLLEAFRNCETYDELLVFAQGPYAAIESSKHVYSEFYRHISVHRNEIEFLMGCAAKQVAVDLSQRVDYRGKFTPREIVVNNAFIAWEGTLESARLRVSPATIQLTATYFSSLKEYLVLIQNSLRLPLDFPDIFEVMIMKRFQNLFQDPMCPKNVLPEFFDTPLLGSCENLKFSSKARPMPRIRHKGSGRCLQDTEACKKDWPFLLQDMDKHGFLCLKPPLRSASSDVLFVGNVVKNGDPFRYTVGIAAKNYGQNSLVHPAAIRDECRKFNAMFEGSVNRIRRLNILIICATNYGATQMSRFQGKSFFIFDEISDWKNIDEVLVLDLCSNQNRAKFFGLNLEDPLNAVIDEVIAKHKVP